MKRMIFRHSMQQMMLAGNLDIASLYFQDESHFSKKEIMVRSCTSKRGTRVELNEEEMTEDQSYSLFATISFWGMLSWQMVPSSGSASTERDFWTYLISLLAYLPHAAVLIMDRCSFHTTDYISNILSYMNTIFLPGYSPDYNPIEMYFNSIKTTLRTKESKGKSVMERVSNEIENTKIDVYRNIIIKGICNWYSEKQ